MAEKNRQMQAVSPLLQKIINWSSAIGAFGTVAFCLWAYSLASSSPRKLSQPLSSRLASGDRLSLSSCRFCRRSCPLSLAP